ncbi:hypothetical protein C804_04256 [Lachnospiraceae bacterium A4]|nr:hypothetical protein C804_04256 [Lachnospiraceae bacterium A4]MDE6363377.1 hypothetical protein [Lachnospiraceae bacterium]
MTKCKYDLKPWLVMKWCIPKVRADFVASMYVIPEVYQHPNDPLRPVICINETNKQLIKEKRIQCESECSEKVD